MTSMMLYSYLNGVSVMATLHSYLNDGVSMMTTLYSYLNAGVSVMATLHSYLNEGDMTTCTQIRCQ